MYIVVYKQSYYPSVFECETLAEAEDLYQKIMEKEFADDDEYEERDLTKGKVYIAQVAQSYGNHNSSVDWYLYFDE